MSDNKQTYVEILKSTSLIGISSVASIFFSIVRMKVLAVLLGPGGVGLFGLYSLIADFATSLAGMGAQSSGVRQVAAAVGTGVGVGLALRHSGPAATDFPDIGPGSTSSALLRF